MKASYSAVFLAATTDGGQTCAFPGPGALAYLTHVEVTSQLATVGARQKSGAISRTGPEGFLGFLRLNDVWWENPDDVEALRVEPPCIALALSLIHI